MLEAVQVTHEDHHRALVRRLATEVKPTRRLWSVGVRLGIWILLEVGVLAWVVTHTDNDSIQKLRQPVYTIEILFFAAAAIISATSALRSAVPGRALRASEATLAAVLLLTGAALVAAGPMNTTNPLGDFVRAGLPCARETWMLAAAPLLLLWWMVRRGASMRGGLSGLLVGAGALFFSFAMMRIACPIDEPLHVLTWHLLPALALIALSTLAGGVWLRFRRRARHPDSAD